MLSPDLINIHSQVNDPGSVSSLVKIQVGKKSLQLSSESWKGIIYKLNETYLRRREGEV